MQCKGHVFLVGFWLVLYQSRCPLRTGEWGCLVVKGVCVCVCVGGGGGGGKIFNKFIKILN